MRTSRRVNHIFSETQYVFHEINFPRQCHPYRTPEVYIIYILFLYLTTCVKFLMVRKRYGLGYGGESSSRGHSAAFVTRKNNGKRKKHTNKRWEAFSARGGVGLHIYKYIFLVEYCPDGAPRIVIIISRHVTIKIFLNDNRIRWFIEEKNSARMEQWPFLTGE